jgi:hypothetical protein
VRGEAEQVLADDVRRDLAGEVPLHEEPLAKDLGRDPWLHGWPMDATGAGSRHPPREAVTLRRATAEDATLLAELGARTFRDAFAADNTPDDMAAYLAQAFAPARQAAGRAPSIGSGGSWRSGRKSSSSVATRRTTS